MKTGTRELLNSAVILQLHNCAQRAPAPEKMPPIPKIPTSIKTATNQNKTQCLSLLAPLYTQKLTKSQKRRKAFKTLLNKPVSISFETIYMLVRS